MMDREAALRLLAKHRTTEFVVRGWTEWDHIDPSDRNFIGVRAMGHHGGFALGLAMAQPDHTFICFEGDGGILMNLGILVTIANANPRNLILIILNNGAYEITGGQPVPGVGKARLVDIARGAGIHTRIRVADAGGSRRRHQRHLPWAGANLRRFTRRTTPDANGRKLSSAHARPARSVHQGAE